MNNTDRAGEVVDDYEGGDFVIFHHLEAFDGERDLRLSRDDFGGSEFCL